MLSQYKMLSDLDTQVLLDDIGDRGDDKAMIAQATVYRHVIGKMLFIDRKSAPFMLLHASIAASNIADLRCHHLRALATTLKRLKSEPVELYFIAPNCTATT